MRYCGLIPPTWCSSSWWNFFHDIFIDFGKKILKPSLSIRVGGIRPRYLTVLYFTYSNTILWGIVVWYLRHDVFHHGRKFFLTFSSNFLKILQTSTKIHDFLTRAPALGNLAKFYRNMVILSEIKYLKYCIQLLQSQKSIVDSKYIEYSHIFFCIFLSIFAGLLRADLLYSSIARAPRI